MDRYALTWNYLYIKDAIKGGDCLKRWIEYIIQQRKKENRAIWSFLIQNTGG